jgi:acetylornithine deacetylase/succinyl-diaminopimelate desuccinylase-like protein
VGLILAPNSASIETLLEKEFKPARTLVLAFGFDEEVSGHQVSDTRFLHLGI